MILILSPKKFKLFKPWGKLFPGPETKTGGSQKYRNPVFTGKRTSLYNIGYNALIKCVWTIEHLVTCVTLLVKTTNINLDSFQEYTPIHTVIISIFRNIHISIWYIFGIRKTFNVCHIFWGLRNLHYTSLLKEYSTLPLLFFCSLRTSQHKWSLIYMVLLLYSIWWSICHT